MLNDATEYNRKIRQDLLIEYRNLRFHTTWGLFSPRAIDAGSHLLLEHAWDSGRLLGLEMTEINPILDDRNRTAELAVELVLSALGRRIV